MYANVQLKKDQYVLEYNYIEPAKDAMFFTSSYKSYGFLKATTNIWHQRMGQLNKKALLHLPNATDGVKLLEKSPALCKTCQLLNAKQQILRRTVNYAIMLFERVHLDLAQLEDQPEKDQPAKLTMRQNAIKDSIHLNTMITSKCILEYTPDSLKLTQNTLDTAEHTLDLEERRQDKEMPHAQNISADMDENNIIKSYTRFRRAAYMMALVCA